MRHIESPPLAWLALSLGQAAKAFISTFLMGGIVGMVLIEWLAK